MKECLAQTLRMSSSLRCRPLHESITLAKSIAMSRGVSRVVETTWLDKIGIPTFASIRPDALKGSIAVHAGKGFTPEEAKIGALMEAIEFSFSPFGRSPVKYRMSKPIDVLNSFAGGLRFVDFCPVLGRKISPDDEIATVEAEEFMTGLGTVLIPAEHVFHPAFGLDGKRLYGTSTNGLASGNSVEEATVHALCEVLERDVRSFDQVKDRSSLVTMEGASAKVRSLVDRVQQADLVLKLRYTENCFGLPYFSCYVMEQDTEAAIPIAGGFGLHPIKEIAAVRAIAEAVQSRATYIHGGRDDVIKRYMLAQDVGREVELRRVAELFDIASNDRSIVQYGSIPDLEGQASTIEATMSCLTKSLRGAGFRFVTRVLYTDHDYPFQVVRIVVPGAEGYDPDLKRVGPRLLKEFGCV